jgi:hypothetical protein
VKLLNDYSLLTQVRSLGDPRNLASALLYLILVALAWRRNKVILQALVVTVLSYLPVSNMVGYVGFVVAERVLYTPSMGICFLLGVGFARLWCRRSRSALAIGFVLLLTMHAARTVKRNLDWRCEETLYRSGLAVNPPKGKKKKKKKKKKNH